jgi:hypothetical protein
MIRSSLSLIALAALVGCSTSSGEVKLGVDVAPIGSAASAIVVGAVDGVDASGAADQVGASTSAATGGLVIERVRLLVAHAKVGYTGGGSDGADAEAGPFVIELSKDEIANGAHREFSLGQLEAGTYGGAEIEIMPPDGSGSSSDPSWAEFVSRGASVLIDGTYKGAAFDFAGHFLAEQGTDGEVTIDPSTPVSLAMSVDPSTWFEDASGAPVDPTDATLHDATAVAICKTLDTQPQGVGPSKQAASRGGGSKGGGRGGGQAHCVEQAGL